MNNKTSLRKTIFRNNNFCIMYNDSWVNPYRFFVKSLILTFFGDEWVLIGKFKTWEDLEKQTERFKSFDLYGNN